MSESMSFSFTLISLLAIETCASFIEQSATAPGNTTSPSATSGLSGAFTVVLSQVEYNSLRQLELSQKSFMNSCILLHGCLYCVTSQIMDIIFKSLVSHDRY